MELFLKLEMTILVTENLNKHWMEAMLYQSNRVFTTVVLDLAEDKFVNLTQTFFNKKDHYV
jgi:hypothetical protein